MRPPLVAFLGLFAAAATVSGLKIQQATRNVAEPSAVDANFLRSIAEAPGDVLVLLYSPTCPDCEWLMEKVWKKVAEKLAPFPDTTVMTISDPGFAAPKPFEHWHNPAIFWVGRDQKMQPIFFPQARLQEYLGGLASRPQEQQDSDFAEDILVFAKGALGFPVASSPSSPAYTSQGTVRDVERLADKGWGILQGKWAAQRRAAAAAKPAAQVPQYAGYSQAGYPQASQYAALPAAQYTLPQAAALPPLAPLSQVPDMASFQSPGSFPQAPPSYPQAPPVASLVSAGQTLQTQAAQSLDVNSQLQSLAPQAQQLPGIPQQPSQLAMAYAENFMHQHSTEGYTLAGVYNYALPYYQHQPR